MATTVCSSLALLCLLLIQKGVEGGPGSAVFVFTRGRAVSSMVVHKLLSTAGSDPLACCAELVRAVRELVSHINN